MSKATVIKLNSILGIINALLLLALIVVAAIVLPGFLG